MIFPKTLSRYDSPESLHLIRLLEDCRSDNCFNPSFVYYKDLIFIAFRAYGPGKTKPFHSYLLIYNQKKQSRKITNLSEAYSQYEINAVADPKLIVLNNEVWVTFNTGYSSVGNSLYLAQIYPDINRPYLCEYPDRQTVEKNWAFFVENGSLKALYSLSPLCVLGKMEQDTRAHTMQFAKDFEGEASHKVGSNSSLSIGTQVLHRQGKQYLIAHVKKKLLGKRLYLGAPVCIEKKSHIYVLKTSRVRISHSYISMLGAIQKHNKYLLSCTYFSGLQSVGDDMILGYGVNDIGYSFKKLKFNMLWKEDCSQK